MPYMDHNFVIFLIASCQYCHDAQGNYGTKLEEITGYEFKSYSNLNITTFTARCAEDYYSCAGCLLKRMLPLCTRAEMEFLNAIFSRGFWT
jgi:hypothetical protein